MLQPMARARPANAVAPEPATAAATTASSPAAEAADHHHHQQQRQRPAVLTVWRKSLLPTCTGFTVFDAAGDLAFRVDRYGGADRRAEVVLMDVAGAPLLTVRRRRSLGLARRCVIYDGDAAAAAEGGRRKAEPFLSVRRHAGLGSSSSSSGNANANANANANTNANANGKAPLAYVTPLGAAGDDSGAEAYVVEGSYGHGACECAVRDARGGDVVAEVRRNRKAHVGDDVFRLVAWPRLGAPLAMGLVIALDEMFAGGGSARSLLRRTWSA